MGEGRLLPRLARFRLEEALTDTPVVLVHGPRQAGKSALTRVVASVTGHGYVTLDADVQLEAARSDPTGFLAGLPDKVVLDEVQRVPEIFRALKLAVDRDRRPGRFILTGSANVLLLPRLADSLAGRMEILRLHPLSQAEIAGGAPRFLDRLIAGAPSFRPCSRLGQELFERIAAGGYPAALRRTSHGRRSRWYREYLATVLQRDVREVATIRSLDVLPRLAAMAAGQTARLINVNELAAPFQLSRPTIGEYMAVLERLFVVERLQPWHSNRLSRLVKTPKLHVGDTGVAAALLGLTPQSLARDRKIAGQFLETFVYQELRRQASGLPDPIEFHHYRDRDGHEVDIVLEVRGQDLVGIEVKASATVRATDFRGLRRLQRQVGERLVAGVVLYDGESPVAFGPRLHAVPIRALWEPDPAR